MTNAEENIDPSKVGFAAFELKPKLLKSLSDMGLSLIHI